MSGKITVNGLLQMQAELQEEARRLDQCRADIRVDQKRLEEAVCQYNTQRVDCVKQELGHQALTWCTKCFTIFPESEAELLLFTGKEEYTSGYENSCYGLRDFLEFHRVCKECGNKAGDKHGSRGEYDSILNDQSIFYAFRVERRPDGYYARKFGNWVRLEDGKLALADLPSRLVDELAARWHIPHKINLKDELT